MTIVTQKYEKVAFDYFCKSCNYTCSNKTNFNKHLSTRCHINNDAKVNHNIIVEKPVKLFTCKCGKNYKFRQGLHAHKKSCENTLPIINPSIDINMYTIMNRLIVDNQELRQFILDQSTEHRKETNELITKTIESCKPSHTTINGNVNKFNLNVFLNEQCKDAINFTDFVNKIEITYNDLENNAQLGFVNGISKIFLDNLKQLGINERPIHCTDVKRETMYIKDEDKWTREIDDVKLQKAIQTVSYRSMGKLAEWKQENPEYKDCNSDFSQKCIDIHRHTLAGSDRQVYYPKVIHVLARETTIEHKGILCSPFK